MGEFFTDIKNKYNINILKESVKTLQNQASDLSIPNKSEIYADLGYQSKLLDMVTKLLNSIDNYNQAKEILSNENDIELINLAKQDVEKLEEEIVQLDEEISDMEVKHRFEDPDDLKSVMLEIRAGAGGEEASLFAGDLFRMYSHYANLNNWKIEIEESSISESGGYKEVIASIHGDGVYKKLKYESGVHRVQRIPTTESSGRIHTSTASVAILPQAKDIDIQIKPEDLRIDVMRASGAGGQCVNRTDSAVRLTHIPTGIVVSCQETKHQSQNKEKAMAILRARLYARKKKEEQEKRDSLRSSQIGSMMRAEKIRTYNFPQSRVTDHRTKQSWFNIDSIMNGDLENIVSDIDEEILKIRLAEEKALEIKNAK